MSLLIRKVTGEPCSHVAIRTDEHVIHSNLWGVRADEASDFHSETVFSVDITEDYRRLLNVFADNYKSPYDFGALLYMAARSALPWLPKKNLWQCSGMFLCTEWVTKYLDGVENSTITPYKLYQRMINEKPS